MLGSLGGEGGVPAGSLGLLASLFNWGVRPCLCMRRLAGHVCHACFRGLSSPVENKEGFNPCLPRYCAACKQSENHAGAPVGQGWPRFCAGTDSRVELVEEQCSVSSSVSGGT